MKQTLLMSFLATVLITLLTVNVQSNYSTDKNTQDVIVFAGVNGHGSQHNGNCDSGSRNNDRYRHGGHHGDQGHGVPEPMTMALVAGSMIGLGFYRKYKKDDAIENDDHLIE